VLPFCRYPKWGERKKSVRNGKKVKILLPCVFFLYDNFVNFFRMRIASTFKGKRPCTFHLIRHSIPMRVPERLTTEITLIWRQGEIRGILGIIITAKRRSEKRLRITGCNLYSFNLPFEHNDYKCCEQNALISSE